MKTTEEKEKSYDEVVNKLRHFIAKGVDPLITRADVQDFFPELAESVDEKMKEFIDKMDKEHKEIEDVFTARIKKLFEQYVELNEAASLGYDKFLALFRLGYELGWNDHRDATAVE